MWDAGAWFCHHRLVSVVVVGHGLWVLSLQHVYDLKLKKTVSLLKETRNIKLI
jgi:hypothetical protein